MNRTWLVFSVIAVSSLGFASSAQAQSWASGNDWLAQYPGYSPQNGLLYRYNGNQNPSPSSNAKIADFLTQYPINSSNQNVGLPNVATSNRSSQQALPLAGTASTPALYKPYYADGQRVKLIPYSSPNPYAAPRYMVVPAPR
jgi:hypothetical protein